MNFAEMLVCVAPSLATTRSTSTTPSVNALLASATSSTTGAEQPAPSRARRSDAERSEGMMIESRLAVEGGQARALGTNTHGAKAQ
jgi:hypothetical protein